MTKPEKEVDRLTRILAEKDSEIARLRAGCENCTTLRDAQVRLAEARNRIEELKSCLAVEEMERDTLRKRVEELTHEVFEAKSWALREVTGKELARKERDSALKARDEAMAGVANAEERGRDQFRRAVVVFFTTKAAAEQGIGKRLFEEWANMIQEIKI